MLNRFCLYGFLKNQRYFEPFLILAFLEQGLSFFWIGVLIAIRSLTVNLLEIPSGAIADSWSRRYVMIISFVAYIASFLLFATGHTFAAFAVAMILYGVGESFRTGTHKAMIFEWLRMQNRIDERTRFYGITRSWSKYGSAVSAIIAAILVALSGSYRAIFLFAIIPYVANIINFMGYPRQLDGEQASNRSITQTWKKLTETFITVLRMKSLRRLVGESMAWEGVFHAVKDYIQPVLAAVVIGSLVVNDPTTEAGRQMIALVIGATYTLLFFISGLASRFAHRFSNLCGSESRAARQLWLINGLMYVALALFAWFVQLWVVVVLFIVMNILQNIWRPILISRFDEFAEPGSGATVLSIESQGQRLATLVLAPLIGLWIDWASSGSPGDVIMDQRFYPIGIVGGVAALFIWITSFKTQRHDPPATHVSSNARSD